MHCESLPSTGLHLARCLILPFHSPIFPHCAPSSFFAEPFRDNFRVADDPEVVAWSLGLKLKATLYRFSMRACFRRLRYSWAAFSASSSRGLLVARCPSS